MLLRANYAPQEKKWGLLQAGQLVTTSTDLAHETGLSLQAVKYHLRKLESTHNITIQTTNRFSLITLVNWALYQSVEETTTHKTTHGTDSKQPAKKSIAACQTDSFLLYKKKERNKEEKNSTNVSLDSVPFEEFWSLYPRKEDKLAARRKWEALQPDAALFEKMKASIEAKKQTDEWRKDKGKFIPMPSTWLHRRRWEDETTPENRARKTDLDELF